MPPLIGPLPLPLPPPVLHMALAKPASISIPRPCRRVSFSCSYVVVHVLLTCLTKAPRPSGVISTLCDIGDSRARYKSGSFFFFPASSSLVFVVKRLSTGPHSALCLISHKIMFCSLLSSPCRSRTGATAVPLPVNLIKWSNCPNATPRTLVEFRQTSPASVLVKRAITAEH